MTGSFCLSASKQRKMMKYVVRAASWDADRDAIRKVREEVFVIEQAVDPELEWDGLDAGCDHAVVTTEEGEVIGTGRLICADGAGKIGRMAVLAQHRGSGAGMAILEFLVELARSRGMLYAALNSQTHALPFYERAGFVAEGPEFEEANIPHRHMRMELQNGRR